MGTVRVTGGTLGDLRAWWTAGLVCSQLAIRLPDARPLGLTIYC